MLPLNRSVILPLVRLAWRYVLRYWLVATGGVALRYIGFARDVVSLLVCDSCYSTREGVLIS